MKLSNFLKFNNNLIKLVLVAASSFTFVLMCEFLGLQFFTILLFLAVINSAFLISMDQDNILRYLVYPVVVLVGAGISQKELILSIMFEYLVLLQTNYPFIYSISPYLIAAFTFISLIVFVFILIFMLRALNLRTYLAKIDLTDDDDNGRMKQNMKRKFLK